MLNLAWTKIITFIKEKKKMSYHCSRAQWIFYWIHDKCCQQWSSCFYCNKLHYSQLKQNHSKESGNMMRQWMTWKLFMIFKMQLHIRLKLSWKCQMLWHLRIQWHWHRLDMSQCWIFLATSAFFMSLKASCQQHQNLKQHQSTIYVFTIIYTNINWYYFRVVYLF